MYAFAKPVNDRAAKLAKFEDPDVEGQKVRMHPQRPGVLVSEKRKNGDRQYYNYDVENREAPNAGKKTKAPEKA